MRLRRSQCASGAGPCLIIGLLVASLLAASGCGEAEPESVVAAESPSRSANAKLGFAQRQGEHPETPSPLADAEGRAWLALPDPGEPLVAGSHHRFEIVYEAAGRGIAAGGAVYLQVSPHWGWSRPQLEDPASPGYTEVETETEGVSLAPRLVGDRGLLAVVISGRGLTPGERVRIIYGAGSARAQVDRFAERGSPLWLGVDADGDGVWSLLAEPPRVDVVAGPPVGLVLLLPGSARPGERVPLTVALLDQKGSAGAPIRGELRLVDPPDGLSVPELIPLEPGDGGHRRVEILARAAGIHRLKGRIVIDGVQFEAESNPMLVGQNVQRLLWGDLHGHSQLSDGTGRPEDYFRYARDVAALDVAALTDHDRWGVRFLDTHPESWQAIRDAVQEFYAPGHFVVLLGYEWTSWLHGHRHVLYFQDDGPVLSAGDSATETPPGLWQALARRRALTFAHHSAGEPIATNWRYPPDPVLEPITEITSVHGSSESRDTPRPIRGGLDGNFVRDVLDTGVRFGFIGSGDSHDGHPGLAHLTVREGGGLAAIFSEERTREGVYQALRARRVYATNGARIWLQVSLDGRPMGAVLPAASATPHELSIEVAAEAALERVDWIRSGAVVESLDPGGRRDWSWKGPVPALSAGEYLYVRVVQEGGGAAWSSPFYADQEHPEE